MEYPNNGAKRIQPREAPENGISRVRKSRKKLKKSSAPQGVTANNKKQVKEMNEMTANELYGLIQYLKALGWDEKEIVKLIECITR